MLRAGLLAIVFAFLLAGAEPRPAARIVSTNPSLTQMLVALGASDRLVGVDDFSARSQPEVAHLPRVGGLYNVSAEAVAALEPDLVVLVPSVQQREFREQLGGLGIRVLELDPRSFEEVLDTLRLLGEATGSQAAARARVDTVRRVRAALERASAGRDRSRSVLVLQRDPLYVVGAGNFIDAMLRSAGAENLGVELGAGYPRASLEWLIAIRPELILDAASDPTPASEYWSRWPSLPAVRDARVVALTPEVATLPGPYLDRALRVLAQAIHGEDILGGDGAAAGPGGNDP